MFEFSVTKTFLQYTKTRFFLYFLSSNFYKYGILKKTLFVKHLMFILKIFPYFITEIHVVAKDVSYNMPI